MRDLRLSQLARTGLCEKADYLRSYNVNRIDPLVAEKREAIAAAIAQWEKDIYDDTFPLVQAAFKVENYEGSAVLRDLFASDLAMQLNRMGCYLEEKKAIVAAGRGATVVLGKAPDEIYIHGSVDFFVTIEDIRYAVKVKGKTVFSQAARKPENMPMNSAELAWLALAGGGHGAIWTLSHKDDTGSSFAERYDEAVAKSGKVITGKNIVSLAITDTDCEETLLRAIRNAEEHPSCDTCDCKNLCMGNFTFRCKAQEEKSGKKEFSWSKEQEAVISFKEGKMAVLAGPGSGKTAVLVERYVRLIESGIEKGNILLLVFSNAVAEEIRTRISERLSLDRFQRARLNVMTLNAFGQLILNENPSAFDEYGRRFVVADSCERKRLLTEILFPATEDGSGLMSLRHRYRNLYGAFYGLDSLNKLMEKLDKGATAEELKLTEEDFAEAQAVNKKLHERLSQMNAINYEQQITMPLAFFEGKPKMAEMYSKEYRYIMVDEAQDLDELQMKLIRLISQRGNLVMVGDDDQSIYRFRRGSAEHLLSFAKESKTKVVILRDNFRASKNLNSLANSLIAEECVEERRAKGYRYLRDGNAPEVVDDATRLTSVVSSLLAEGVPARDIAILARTNKALDGIAEVLKGTVECSNSKDYVREDAVFCFLRGALDMALRDADAEPMSVYRVERAMNSLTIPASTNNLPENVAATIDDLRKKLNNAGTVEQALEAWIEELALPNLTPSHPIMGMIRDWCEVKDLNDTTLLAHMDRMVRLEDDSRIDYGADEDKVRLYTAHDSKGKEFPVVIIADGEAYADESGSSEELRLLYVAMTRAKNRLIVMGRAGAENPYFTFLKKNAVPFEFRKKGGIA